MGRPAVDLTGQKFNRLTVLCRGTKTYKSGDVLWKCRCECGTEKEICGHVLRRGKVVSCGCWQRELAVTHGWTKGGVIPPELGAYYSARGRCRTTNKKSAEYRNYAGRGIKFLFASFEEFLKEVGPRPGPEYSLDRIDNNSNYQPGNVRWATHQEQVDNQRPRKSLDNFFDDELIAALDRRGYVSIPIEEPEPW